MQELLSMLVLNKHHSSNYVNYDSSNYINYVSILTRHGCKNVCATITAQTNTCQDIYLHELSVNTQQLFSIAQLVSVLAQESQVCKKFQFLTENLIMHLQQWFLGMPEPPVQQVQLFTYNS